MTRVAPYREVGGKLRLELDQEKLYVKELEQIMNKVDCLSEELRGKRRVIAELEGQNARLANYKEQYGEIRMECDKLRAANKELAANLDRAKEELADMKTKRQLETAKYKKSFGELETLLARQKETQTVDEAKLLEESKALETKLKSVLDTLGELKLDKERNERYYQEQIDMLKESKKKLYASLEDAKQRETQLEVAHKEAKRIAAEAQDHNKTLELKINKLATEALARSDVQRALNDEKAKARDYSDL